MTSKRDVQLVRLACRWRWLSAEQGEECLALERKLAGKHTIEEILRRRGYLDEDAITKLAEAADQATGRRRPLFGRPDSKPASAPSRPVMPRGEQTVVRAIHLVRPPTPEVTSNRPSRRPRRANVAPAPAPEPLPVPPPAEPSPGGLGSAVPAVHYEPDPVSEARIEEPELPRGVSGVAPPEVTRFEPNPWFEREGSRTEPAPPVDEDDPLAEPALPESSRVGPIPAEVTRYEPGLPSAFQPTPDREPTPPPAPSLTENQDRTVMAPLPEELLARLRGPDPEPALPSATLPEVIPQDDMDVSKSTAALEIEIEVRPTSRVTEDLPHDAVETDAGRVPSPREVTVRPVGEPPPSFAPRGPSVAPSGGVRPRSRGPTVTPFEGGAGARGPSITPSFIGPADRGPSVTPAFAEPAPLDAPPPRGTSVPHFDPSMPLSAPEIAPRAVTDPQASLPGVSPLAGPLEESLTVDEQFSLLEEEGLAEALIGPFGPYELERILARGAQSVVYLGRDVETGNRVAVKVLARDPADNQAFITARGGTLIAAASIRSPYIVRILDVGRVDSRHYVTLEYVEGWTLADKLALEDPPGPARSFAWASQVAAALAAARAAGVPHGDVRPDRVLIDPIARARLSGFGFSPLEPVPGAPYAPPEGPSESAAADAYGLGTVLQAALTGGDPEAVLPSVLPEPARALVASLLDPNPAARPTDFGGLSTTLSALAEELEQVPEPEVVDTKPPLRGLVLRSAAVAVGLLVVTAGALLGLRLVGLGADLTKQLSLHSALAGVAGLSVATVLLGTLDLIRRGELPLPVSTQWLVQVGEGAGAFGALLGVVQLAIGPPAIMHALLAVLGAGLVFSAVLGVVLRRAVAQARPDRGVGRILAVLSDPWLLRWRQWHGPALTTVTFLATARFALLAYFAAS